MHFYVHARIGQPAEQLLQVARDVGADLILVGSHEGKGLERVVLGSVSEQVVREAGCTVEVVRAKAYAHVDPCCASSKSRRTRPTFRRIATRTRTAR